MAFLNRIGRVGYLGGVGRGQSAQTLQQQVNALFEGGKKGFFLAPWNLDTLFQERTGASATTPAGVGDVVGTIADMSPNGYYAVAVSDAKRMVLRQSGGLYYLEPDGIDDCYKIDSFAIGTTQYEWQAIDQDGSLQFFFEHSINVGTGQDGHWFYGSNGGSWRINRTGSQYDLGAIGWANGLHVVEREYVATIGGSIYKDGSPVAPVSISGTARAEATLTKQMNLLCRDQTSVYFDGDWYGGCLIGDAPSSANKLAIRQLFAEKSGVTL